MRLILFGVWMETVGWFINALPARSYVLLSTLRSSLRVGVAPSEEVLAYLLDMDPNSRPKATDGLRQELKATLS